MVWMVKHEALLHTVMHTHTHTHTCIIYMHTHTNTHMSCTHTHTHTHTHTYIYIYIYIYTHTHTHTYTHTHAHIMYCNQLVFGHIPDSFPFLIILYSTVDMFIQLIVTICLVLPTGVGSSHLGQPGLGSGDKPAEGFSVITSLQPTADKHRSLVSELL